MSLLSLSAGDVIYVDASTKGKSSDGKAWESAYGDLQEALKVAKNGDSIWVAKGVYYPSKDRKLSFVMKEGVSIYGGFAGGEKTLAERDYKKNETILSGDIGGGDKTKNSITIIKGANGALLDGFTVSGAYSKDESRMHLLPSDIKKNDMEVGGGMRNFMVSPKVKNVTFKDNYSPKGGAVYNVQDSNVTQAHFENIEFTNNTAQMRGGAVSNDLGAMPVFIDCIFVGNKSEDKGGGLYNDFAASPILINALFEKNSAITAGAIGNDGGSSPLLLNVTIRDNNASAGLGKGLYQGTGKDNNPIVINSNIDSVYNWHENIVGEHNSQMPKNSSLTLAKFIELTDLKGSFELADIETLPKTRQGYDPNLDTNSLLNNKSIKKLLNIYKERGGYIGYKEEFKRRAIETNNTLPIIYVSKGKKGDGSSWDSPLDDLQKAIDLASSNGAEVWISKGVYTPKKKPNDIAAFTLYDGVKLYGGFAGGEINKEGRLIKSNPTILKSKSKDAEYNHVLYGANDAVLDGVVIEGGDAKGFSYHNKGGALIAYHAGKTYSPFEKDHTGFKMEIKNCVFKDNKAYEGGAIYAFSKADLNISNTTFIGNSANNGGAIMDREGNKINCQKCTFENNVASISGGATYEDYGSHALYQDSSFIDNKATYKGGAIYVISRASQLEATELTVKNSKFEGNKAKEGENVYKEDSSVVNIEE